MLKLIPLLQTDTSAQLTVRDFRNDEIVRKFLPDGSEITQNEHLVWVSRLKQDKSELAFTAYIDESPAAMLAFTKINRADLSAELYFHIPPSVSLKDKTAMVNAMTAFAFGTLGLEKLNVQCVEGDSSSVLLKSLGFKEEGFKRAELLREGKRIGVHLMGLLKDEFTPAEVSAEISFDNNGEAYLHPLDAIEAARAKNNLNWMSILRLVLELSPEHGTNLVRDIRDLDKQISAHTDDLVNFKK
ncbi:MAG: GNAT family N-acetyltransferase [Deferribacterales bacterium]